MSHWSWRRAPGSVGLALALVGLLTSLVACTGDRGAGPEPTPTTTTTTPSQVSTTTLTFAVFGNRAEIAAYQSVVNTYNRASESVRVELRPYPDADNLAGDLLDGGDVPDLFMLSRDHLARVTEEQLPQPVLELVDERGVDFGDGYSRDALNAFSADDDLQCMPYDVSPEVIYYNTELIDFARMARRDLDAPEIDEQFHLHPRWTFEQFRVAAEFASRPRLGTKGVHVEPTLDGLAPFVYAGGAELFDDREEPTTLELSSDDSREALTRTLEVLREPSVTLTEKQLAQRRAVEWFKRGKLGMLSGDRDLLPELRQAKGLRFDVMPIPTMDGPATTGELSGVCLAAKRRGLSRAADFLVDFTSVESVSRVAEVGYLVPANLQVAQSEAFLQPGQYPDHSQVFNDAVADLRLPPLLGNRAALDRAVAGTVTQLFRMPVLDLEALTTQIDEQSRTVLDPELVSESPAD